MSPIIVHVIVIILYISLENQQGFTYCSIKKYVYINLILCTNQSLRIIYYFCILRIILSIKVNIVYILNNLRNKFELNNFLMFNMLHLGISYCHQKIKSQLTSSTRDSELTINFLVNKDLFTDKVFKILY